MKIFYFSTLAIKVSSYFSGELLNYVLANINNSKSENSGSELSDEETNMLKLFTKSISDEEIAKELNIKHAAVDVTRKNLMHKTGCKNTAALVMFAIKNKVVSI